MIFGHIEFQRILFVYWLLTIIYLNKICIIYVSSKVVWLFVTLRSPKPWHLFPRSWYWWKTIQWVGVHQVSLVMFWPLPKKSFKRKLFFDELVHPWANDISYTSLFIKEGNLFVLFVMLRFPNSFMMPILLPSYS
jgi:hypothetical protein